MPLFLKTDASVSRLTVKSALAELVYQKPLAQAYNAFRNATAVKTLETGADIYRPIFVLDMNVDHIVGITAAKVTSKSKQISEYHRVVRLCHTVSSQCCRTYAKEIYNGYPIE